jgi:7,8-dihydropterin-6-yl-methyl-4-(beta-D-ribofuranosyl)aminobenzene 5'-phosphate synthase
MEVRITTLSENTANFGFIAEWGLSILVEVEGTKILVDTGMSISAAHNAQLLGVDLSAVDWIVLSHGHADHTGGLREVLQRSGKVKVIGHPNLWSRKYVRRTKGPEQYNGIPFSQKELEDLGAHFHLTRKPFYINERIMTTGEIPMLTSYEEIETNLSVQEEGVLQPDKLADDLALIINADFGLVVILGCAHRGMVNTLRHAQKLTGNELVFGVIGGTHLFRASHERINKTIADLKEMGIQRLGVSHCTGFHASTRLAQEFGNIFFLNNAGTRMTLP